MESDEVKRLQDEVKQSRGKARQYEEKMKANQEEINAIMEEELARYQRPGIQAPIKSSRQIRVDGIKSPIEVIITDFGSITFYETQGLREILGFEVGLDPDQMREDQVIETITRISEHVLQTRPKPRFQADIPIEIMGRSYSGVFQIGEPDEFFLDVSPVKGPAPLYRKWILYFEQFGRWPAAPEQFIDEYIAMSDKERESLWQYFRTLRNIDNQDVQTIDGIQRQMYQVDSLMTGLMSGDADTHQQNFALLPGIYATDPKEREQNFNKLLGLNRRLLYRYLIATIKRAELHSSAGQLASGIAESEAMGERFTSKYRQQMDQMSRLVELANLQPDDNAAKLREKAKLAREWLLKYGSSFKDLILMDIEMANFFGKIPEMIRPITNSITKMAAKMIVGRAQELKEDAKAFEDAGEDIGDEYFTNLDSIMLMVSGPLFEIPESIQSSITGES